MWPTEDDERLEEYDVMALPGHQLNASYAYSPFDHVLKLDIKSPPSCLRLCGIMACMGRSTRSLEILENLMAVGMNIAVLNMSFDTKEEHVEMIKMLRQACKNYSIKMKRQFPLAIAMKLSGKKIRTGKIGDTFGDTIELRTGDTIRLTTDETYSERCSIYTIYVDFIGFPEQMKKHDTVLLDNESIMLKVDVISANTITCHIERGGTLGSYKDIFTPNKVIDMPDFTEREKADIQLAIKYQVDIVIPSFVNTPTYIPELRSMLGEKEKKMSIMANIQTFGGFNFYDEILQQADAVMITRQELGSDVTPNKLVIAQKNLIARANKAGVPVALSAHLLSSMRENILPYRSEVLDVANSVLDGVDVLVLSAETAVGEYPVESVSALASSAKEAEQCVFTKQLFNDLIDITYIPCDQTTGLALSAVLASQRCLAAAIVVVTTTGKSAQVVAKFRPRCPIVAITRYTPIARRLHMWRGVLPLVYEDQPASDWQSDIEKRIAFATKWCMDLGFVRIGDPLVLLSGWRQGVGTTNTMRIAYASLDIQ